MQVWCPPCFGPCSPLPAIHARSALAIDDEAGCRLMEFAPPAKRKRLFPCIDVPPEDDAPAPSTPVVERESKAATSGLGVDQEHPALRRDFRKHEFVYMRAHIRPQKGPRILNVWTLLVLFGTLMLGHTYWASGRATARSIHDSLPNGELQDNMVDSQYTNSNESKSLPYGFREFKTDPVLGSIDSDALSDKIKASHHKSMTQQEEHETDTLIDLVDAATQMHVADPTPDSRPSSAEGSNEVQSYPEGSDASLSPASGPAPAPAPLKCKILILDPSTELASALGVPPCNLSQFEGINPPHWAARHATGYWVTEAIRNGPHKTKQIKLADMIYIDTHCYDTWYYQQWQQQGSEGYYGPVNEVAGWMSHIISDGITQMQQYIRTKGRRMTISRPWLAAPPGAMLTTCTNLQHTFMLASERGVFCDNARDRAADGDSLILPSVVTQGVDLQVTASGTLRPTFLYYYGSCPDPSPIHHEERWLQEELLRQNLLSQKRVIARDMSVSCGCRNCQGGRTEEQEIALMQKSKFCVVVPDKTQSGGSLSEAMLAGCIPVFIGEPFHSLPLANHINYKAFAVFLNLTQHSGLIRAPSAVPMIFNRRPSGDLERNINATTDVVQVEDFAAAVAYLRGIKREQLEVMQAAVDASRMMFYYPPSPGYHTSLLGKTIVRSMCDAAIKAKAAAHEAWLKRQGQPAMFPKTTTPAAADSDEEEVVDSVDGDEVNVAAFTAAVTLPTEVDTAADATT